MTEYFDIHSHLNDSRFLPDLEGVLSRMRDTRTKSIIVGTDLEMSKRAIFLAENYSIGSQIRDAGKPTKEMYKSYGDESAGSRNEVDVSLVDNSPDLWATVGLHPTDNDKEQFDIDTYTEMAKHPRVVGIGECGLDYYWPEHDAWPKGESEEKKRQRELFEKHITVALRVGKPLMIHGRPRKGSMDAYEDIIGVLKQYPGVRGNIHFFVGDVDRARKFLDLGFTMSYTGVLTFSPDYDETVRFLPLESIMSETDAPYVAPKAYRGKRNEPTFVSETVKRIAAIKGEDEERIKTALVENAYRIFGLK